MHDDKRFSKFLSYILRHKPDAINLTLDSNGYASVEELLDRLKNTCPSFSKNVLDRIVTNNNKNRFAYSSDGLRIRASQGHSITVDLDLKPQSPPELLYHGTVPEFIEYIKHEGLQKRSRNHVHLSADQATALNVGSRRGNPIILTIYAKQMQLDGYQFFLSANGVWLTNEVPTKFIQFPQE